MAIAHPVRLEIPLISAGSDHSPGPLQAEEPQGSGAARVLNPDLPGGTVWLGSISLHIAPQGQNAAGDAGLGGQVFYGQTASPTFSQGPQIQLRLSPQAGPGTVQVELFRPSVGQGGGNFLRLRDPVCPGGEAPELGDGIQAGIQSAASPAAQRQGLLEQRLHGLGQLHRLPAV